MAPAKCTHERSLSIGSSGAETVRAINLVCLTTTKAKMTYKAKATRNKNWNTRNTIGMAIRNGLLGSKMREKFSNIVIFFYGGVLSRLTH